MWDLSSLTRDQTLNPSLGVLSPKLPGSPSPIFLDFLPPRKMSEVLIWIMGNLVRRNVQIRSKSIVYLGMKWLQCSSLLYKKKQTFYSTRRFILVNNSINLTEVGKREGKSICERCLLDCLYLYRLLFLFHEASQGKYVFKRCSFNLISLIVANYQENLWDKHKREFLICHWTIRNTSYDLLIRNKMKKYWFFLQNCDVCK